MTMRLGCPRWRRLAHAAWLAAVLGVTACASNQAVLERTAGIVVTLRDERLPSREAPGAGFAADLDARIARSLERVVVIYRAPEAERDSDPVPLFSGEQRAVMQAVLVRELPALPASKRLGFSFFDVHIRHLVVVEVYPEGDRLVYDFRSLQRSEDHTQHGRPPVNMGRLVPQAGQDVIEGPAPVLKDPIAPAGRP